jgi:hypothetical protein
MMNAPADPAADFSFPYRRYLGSLEALQRFDDYTSTWVCKPCAVCRIGTVSAVVGTNLPIRTFRPR